MFRGSTEEAGSSKNGYFCAGLVILIEACSLENETA